mgnify:CR=1 FL=1
MSKKLKCWRNIRKSKGISTWKNKEGAMVWVNNTGNGYTVALDIAYGGKNKYKLFQTKSESLKFAKSFMEKHNKC